MDLLQHPAPTSTPPSSDAQRNPLPPSQAILALSFGCSAMALLVGSLISLVAG